MERFEKKALIIEVYKLLYERSSYENPLNFVEITRIFRNEYGVDVSRKSIASCIDCLTDGGIDIAKGKVKGVYLVERPLDEAEIKFLIDCVCSFNYIDADYSAELIKKLCALGGKPFEQKYKIAYKVQNLQRGENKDLFYNVEIVDEAISLGKKISFDYNKFGDDKKLHKTNTHVVSPFCTFMVNQCYYLMGSSSKFSGIGFFRLDKITNIKPLEEEAQKLSSFEEFKNGLDLDKLFHSYPYMYSGKIEMIEIYCEKNVLDDVINRFGQEIKIKKQGEGYKISVMASIQAMEYWLLQYGTSVTVLSPSPLVEKVKQDVKIMADRYGLK